MAPRLLKCKVTNAEVDWITCTGSSRASQASLWKVAQLMLHRGESEGEHATAWHANGYHGWSNGSVAWGVRKDGSLLRVSGKEAGHQWEQCLRASENCSRLDLAVDCQLQRPMTTLARDVYDDAAHVRPRNGRKPSASIIEKSDGGTTVYIGARPSEWFGRIYDKGREQKVARAGLWWRWELELKGKASYALGQRLLSADDYRVLINSTVAGWFRARTNHTYTSSDVPFSVLLSVTRTSDQRRLHWLSQGVRPTVQSLIDRVGRERVLFALGLLPQSAVEPTSRATTLEEAS